MASKRASITDLATQLGVSVSTVSRALSDHSSISDATKKKVWKLAKALHYQPNHMAAGLRKGRSNLLGVLVPHIDGHFFTLVVKGIETVATKAGFNVLICQSNEDVVHERKNIETLINAQVEGILVSLSRTTHDFQHFEKAQKHGIPLVFFDRILEGKNVSAVVLDDRAGGYNATKHLLTQGYRRIAHFAGPQHLNIYKNRQLGYLDALREFDVPIEDNLIILSDMKIQDGIASMNQLLMLPIRPEAIFSASDFAAVGAMQVLESRGLRVPDDVALVGFSNETFTSLTTPKLTSIDQHCEQMGQSVVRMFLEMLEVKNGTFLPRRVMLQPELIIRESSLRTAAKPATKAGLLG